MDQSVILSACRTPIGSFGGVFKDLSVVELGAIVNAVTPTALRLAPSLLIADDEIDLAISLIGEALS